MIDESRGVLLRLQQTVCAKHGAQFVEVRNYSMVRLAASSLGQQPFQGCRSAVNGASSGWFLWAGENSMADYSFQPVSCTALFEKCPQVIKYLGLPPGYRFIIDDRGREDVWFEPGPAPLA